VKESFASLKDRTLSGAREEYCFRGLSMRLVSLWWELPPWLDSNIRIWISGMQAFLLQNFKENLFFPYDRWV
jgi:hypothetical protein